ncbi:MAG TPA: ribose-phosphate pyrophosphokinase-like domain-containing protein [Actinomycetota bacterium]|nr:ribose-phosphate pyrophosphokinase-like domain-containing protein [Actinomycetota bacterium]
MTPIDDDPLIFAGSASRSLGAEIAEYLRLPLGRGEVIHFSEGNLFVRVLENVRGRHVYLIQGTVFPANDQFMELLFWIDVLKRASAESVTAVIPYFSYAKGDKKDDALPVLCEAIEQKAFPNPVVLSPDAGFAKKARKFARRLRGRRWP